MHIYENLKETSGVVCQRPFGVLPEIHRFLKAEVSHTKKKTRI